MPGGGVRTYCGTFRGLVICRSSGVSHELRPVSRIRVRLAVGVAYLTELAT